MRQSRHPEAHRVPATRGRPFADGNPGRRPGSKNRTTLVAAALLEGEAEELLRKAVELAKGGNVVISQIPPESRTAAGAGGQARFAAHEFCGRRS